MILLKKSIMKDITRIAHIVLNRHCKTPANVKVRWVAHLLLHHLRLLVLPKNPKKGVKNQRKLGKKEVVNAPRVVEPARDAKIKNKK
jgi:hypothetical protein